jgi:hypothetical protein
MDGFDRWARRLLAVTLAGWLLLAAPVVASELKQETIAAFDRYVGLTEARIDAELAKGTPFLWVDGLPDARRAATYAQLRAGHVMIERLETLDDGKPIHVPDGLIHHWIGTVFIPGATLAQTLALVQDYDRHQQYYHPDVMRSKLLAHTGNDYRIYLRFYKKKVLTSVLDTEHEVHYTVVDATHAWSRSRSTRINEVEDAGEANERLKPEGHDRGFLWRIYTYWRFEQKDGGTYVECQSVSLTRSIPTGLGWLIGPYVESVPRESLTFTLGATRAALAHKPSEHNASD